jgi:branched-chain amino acid aminotransferase
MPGAARAYEIVHTEPRLLGTYASISEASAGFPQGAYTTFRTYGGSRVLRFGQHVRRLEESVELQGRPAGPLGSADIGAALAQAIAADAGGSAEWRIRLTFAPPGLFAAIEPFEPLPPALYERGATCVTVPLRRENPHAKDTRFLKEASGAYERLPAGVQEGLMVAEDGAILEGLSSNFFAVRDGALRTEGERVLLGVTRSLVIEVASGLLPVVTTAVREDELASVSECFVTSVSREVLPVVRIDGVAIGGGVPGTVTRRVIAGFEELVRREAAPLTSQPTSPPPHRPGS